MSMENKLKEYRAKREKLNYIQGIQNNLKNVFSFIVRSRIKADHEERMESNSQITKPISTSTSSPVRKRKMKNSDEAESLIIPEDAISLDEESVSDSIWCCSWLQLIYYLLYLILWGTIYIIFIKLQFGTVYLILSALIFMYLNTRTTPKKSGEISAYSVFNKDCVSIDGTLKAEQFEREIMFGAGSIR